MSDERDDGKPGPPDERGTVFRPGSAVPGPPEPPPSQAREEGGWDEADEPVSGPPVWDPAAGTPSEPPADDGGTLWAPGAPPAHEGEDKGWSDPSAKPADAAPAPVQMGSFQPRAASEGIKVGDVLNHIFEVKRFIARGGMGEVFEGCNVSSEERVAIKVMLPSLAQDANVIAMFRKEARTLTRLQHEALVQYRVLAQEPQLGILYIVTEYVDGTNLSDVLGTIRPNPEEMAALLGRLASGLRAAHALGAIHRDMSPDNVLLEGGRLDGAKIIDFGIAKDLDPGSATIVGEGFAGKLNYVAPEQLGDFGREIGPWTDIYSLGLVMLAVASGRDVRMGGTLVDAVDKRRAGPDLGAAPERLRPVLERMLRPNPTDRLRSMDEVLAELHKDGRTGPATAPGAPAKPKPAFRQPSKPLAIFGGAGIAALLVVGAAFFLSRGDPEEVVVKSDEVPRRAITAPTPPADPLEAARAAINGALPQVECSWLDISDLSAPQGRLSVRMTGVAGSPARAQSEISAALSAAGVGAADMDFSEVAQIEEPGCSALDAFRPIRALDAGRLSVPQRTFEIEPLEEEDIPRGSRPLITLAVGNPAKDLALAGIDPSGKIDALILGREALREAVGKGQVAALGDDRFRLTSLLEHVGWSGVLLLTGEGPFDESLLAPPLSERGPAWRQRFIDAARQRGWKAEMVWFKSVDDRPG